jgi:hypothetical protein
MGFSPATAVNSYETSSTEDVTIQGSGTPGEVLPTVELRPDNNATYAEDSRKRREWAAGLALAVAGVVLGAAEFYATRRVLEHTPAVMQALEGSGKHPIAGYLGAREARRRLPADTPLPKAIGAVVVGAAAGDILAEAGQGLVLGEGTDWITEWNQQGNTSDLIAALGGGATWAAVNPGRLKNGLPSSEFSGTRRFFSRIRSLASRRSQRTAPNEADQELEAA